MSLLNNTIKGSRITQDARKDWMKIDGVTLGESQKFGYVSTTSKDIGGLLDKMFKDQKVVAVVYNWKSGQAFVKSGIDVNDPTDSKINTDYTTFIVHSRVTQQINTHTPNKIQNTNSNGFLKPDGDNLSLDGKKFVAVGSNAYWLGYTEEHTYPTKQQIEEMFIAVYNLGGNTIRAHTLGHSSGSPNSLRPYDNKLNEKAWDSIDFAFSMARKYNIKIIAPLTDGYTWYNGNYGHFCTPRGVPKKDFWTNPDVISDFKDYIKNYLNHYNPYNKCLMKDEPALGMIELGNELGNIREGADSITIPTYEWLLEISKYVKSIDPNHLILNPADECLGQSREFSIPSIDCFGAHFYWEDYNRLDNGVKMTRDAGKPYIVGEYSAFSEEKWYRDLESRNVKGSLFWSMYPRKNGINGGDKIPHGDGYTIHFTQDNEKHLLLIAQHFCRLKGVPEVTSINFGDPGIQESPVVTPKPIVTPISTQPGNPGKLSHGDIVTIDGVFYRVITTPSVKLELVQSNVPVTQPQPTVTPVDVTWVWETDKSYKKGEVVRYKDKNYSCIQDHISNLGWMPDLTILILWNLVSTVTPVTQPQPTVTPVTQPQPTVFNGRLQRLLNGKSPIGTYYQSWSAPWASSGENHDLAKIAEPINIVYISFCKADCGYIKGSNSFENTGLQFSSDFNVVKKAIEILRKRGVIVMLSVGGATYLFTVYNPKNVADLCNDLGCNGVDIDWEDEHGFEKFGYLISSTRQALPDGCVSTAGFSVGAYGQGEFTSSPPASSRTGMNIQGLRSDGDKLDWINIMSYDASPVFDPVTSFKAYRSFYKGPLLIGEEVPPEAWGGNVITLEKVKEHSEYVRSQGSENGIFTWSYQKQGTPNSKQILDVAYSVLVNQDAKPSGTDVPVKSDVTVPVQGQQKG